MRILWICLFLSRTLLFCLDLNYPFSASQMAGANLVLLRNTPANTFHNPSVAVSGLIFNYTFPFSDKSIMISDIGYGLKTGNYLLSIGSQYINDDYYKESISYLGVNRAISNFNIGTNLRYLYQKTDSYESIEAFLLDSGISYKKAPFQTTVGINNISESRYKRLKFPVRYQAEIAYQVLTKARIAFGIEKEDQNGINYKIASQIFIFPEFSGISSYESESNESAYGIVIKVKNYEIEYAVQTHPYLNPSHALSFYLKL